MNLSTALADSVSRHPRKTALYWGEAEFSYQQLLDQAGWTARLLQKDFGVRPGDRVGLWLKNCPGFVPALFGILRAGAVAVPINNFLKPDEVAYILADAEAGALVTDQELAVHGPALTEGRPGLRILEVERIPAQPDPADDATHKPERTEQDLAVLVYTSGTTGRPKGAMLSHGNLLSNVESCRIVLEAAEEDCLAVLLPLFHSYMLTVGLLLPLLLGGSMVLVKSLSPMKSVLEDLFRRKATILPCIPQFYRSLASAPIQGPLPLRVCISGAAPLPVQVLKDFEAKFGIPLIEGYGLSEASPVVSKNPLRGTRKPGSIGLPIPGVEVSIQNEQGQTLADNEVGEVCVRGGNVMQGYWKRPEDSAKALRNGWLLTGDIGYRDSEGYFYITDRKKDMLLVNGINVYPREVEEVIYQFPGIKEAAVVGRTSSRRGEQPVAFVALEEGVNLDKDALANFLRERIADYKVPREVTVLPALPRNATGKILKTELRARTSQRDASG